MGGYIAAAFYLFGAPAAILFGYLSHTVSRRALFLLAVLLGECHITRVFKFYFILEGSRIDKFLPSLQEKGHAC